MKLGPIAFLSPMLLAGLLALPLIWWLLRAVPPRPLRIDFPPTRILVGIENRECPLRMAERVNFPPARSGSVGVNALLISA